MPAPRDIGELMEALLRRGDTYLALPAHPVAAADHRTALEALLLRPSRLRLVLAALPFTPSSVLARLAEDVSPLLRLRIARNPATDGPTLAHIHAGFRDERLCLALANHPHTPPAVLADLARADDAAVRLALCRNPATSAETLAQLAEAASDEEAIHMARHTHCPATLLARLWTIGAAAGEVAAHRNCPPTLLAIAVRSRDSLLRRRAAANPMLDPAHRIGLLRDPESTVRAEATRGLCDIADPDADAAVDHSAQVRRATASRQFLPPALAARLAADADHWVRRWLARNPAVTAEVLERLARDEDSFVRRAAGRNPTCPAALLDLLAGDTEGWVRAGVACRPELPALALHRLRADTCIDVLAGLGRNPSTPAHMLHAIARHADADVRRAVLLNRNTGGPVLETLIEDPYPLNRALLVSHSNLAANQTWKLADDPHPQVRFAVGRRAVAALARTSWAPPGRRTGAMQKRSFA